MRYPHRESSGAVAGAGVHEGLARLLTQLDAALHLTEERERQPVALERLGGGLTLDEKLEPSPRHVPVTGLEVAPRLDEIRSGIGRHRRSVQERGQAVHPDIRLQGDFGTLCL